jgi:hypothetical protein
MVVYAVYFCAALRRFTPLLLVTKPNSMQSLVSHVPIPYVERCVSVDSGRHCL